MSLFRKKKFQSIIQDWLRFLLCKQMMDNSNTEFYIDWYNWKLLEIWENKERF